MPEDQLSSSTPRLDEILRDSYAELKRLADVYAKHGYAHHAEELNAAIKRFEHSRLNLSE